MGERETDRLAEVKDAQEKYGLVPALHIPPRDCTGDCGYGPCNCSGEFRVRAWSVESVMAALDRLDSGAAERDA